MSRLALTVDQHLKLEVALLDLWQETFYKEILTEAQRENLEELDKACLDFHSALVRLSARFRHGVDKKLLKNLKKEDNA